jgi:hypothetical protein
MASEVGTVDVPAEDESLNGEEETKTTDDKTVAAVSSTDGDYVPMSSKREAVRRKLIGLRDDNSSIDRKRRAVGILSLSKRPTTISSIAVRSGKTQVVVALLQVSQYDLINMHSKSKLYNA